jgi:hypothetical protein
MLTPRIPSLLSELSQSAEVEAKTRARHEKVLSRAVAALVLIV